MNMIKTIKKLFRRKRQNPFPNTKHVIKHAFTVGGIEYYEFDSTANLPWKRGLKFLSIYNELDMRCDRYYLTKHAEAVENIFTQSKRLGFDEMSKVRQLNAQLKERLEMIFHEDLVYKIASVVFFDAGENPDDWEWKYALEKIERWKKHEGAHDFFFARAHNQVDSLFKQCRAQFPRLFAGGTAGGRAAFGQYLHQSVTAPERDFAKLYAALLLARDETRLNTITDTLFEFFDRIENALVERKKK